MAIKREKKEEEDGNVFFRSFFYLNCYFHYGQLMILCIWLTCPHPFRVVLGGNPFLNLDKTSVLQDARTFNETPVEPRKCTPILTKILYLLNQVLF